MNWQIRVFILTSLIATSPTFAADWQPQKAPLMTRWAKDVSPEKVHPEYPRPQMVREKWVNLNGLWDYKIASNDVAPAPADWDGKILVPFPIESALSGVMKRVPDNHRVIYRRSFATPEMAKDGRLLLHFGASDWETVVSVNGQKVGEHRGGYDPFSFDITDALKPTESNPKRERGTAATDAENELVVAVSDPTDGSFQPRGKQIRKPHGIWYTPTTGIWQTVWLEPVPKTYVRALQITPDLDKNIVTFKLDVANFTESKPEKVDVKVHYKTGYGESTQWLRSRIATAEGRCRRASRSADRSPQRSARSTSRTTCLRPREECRDTARA